MPIASLQKFTILSSQDRKAIQSTQNGSRMAAEWQKNGKIMATEWQNNGNRMAPKLRMATEQQNNGTECPFKAFPQLLLKTENRKGKKVLDSTIKIHLPFFKIHTLTISVCSPNWYLIKNTCYHFDNRNMDFFSASLECISKGA